VVVDVRIILVLSLLLIVVGCIQPKAQIEYGVKYDAKVIDVIDGDTIVVQFQDKIETLRILGVDTPEISRKNNPYEYKTNNLECVRDWGYKAKEFTNSMLKGKNVQIVFDERAGLRDYFGRLLAYVYINGKDFGKMLIENGYARVYVEGEFFKESEYIKAEESALNFRKGVWSCREVIQTPTPTKSIKETPPLTPTLITEKGNLTEECKQYIARYLGEKVGDKYCFTDSTAKKVKFWTPTDEEQLGSTVDAVTTIAIFGGYSYEDPINKTGKITADTLKQKNGGNALTNDDIVWIANHSDGDAKYCYTPTIK